MTYPATLSDLRGRLDVAFMTTSAQFGSYPPARKNQLLNDAQRQMQMRLDTMGEDAYFKFAETVTPTACGDGGFQIHLKNDLSKECIRPIVLGREDGSIWTEVPIIPAADIFGVYRNSGECWYQLNDIIKTDFDIGSAALRKLLFQFRVPDMTIDADVCLLPSDTHECLVYEAAALGCLQTRELEARQFYEQELAKRWELVQRALKADASTKRRVVRQTEFYGRVPRDMAGYRAFWTAQ